MSIDLRFDPTAYVPGSVNVNGVQIPYRFYQNVPYVSKPNAPEAQVMNIYVPEALAEDHSAPIYLLQRTGGMGGCEPYTIEKELETLTAAAKFESTLKRAPWFPWARTKAIRAPRRSGMIPPAASSPAVWLRAISSSPPAPEAARPWWTASMWAAASCP